MGLFSRFEDKAEDMIEGAGGGKGGIEPVKLAKRAFKEMQREKMVGVGHEYAPTLYNILVSAEDDMNMSGYYPSLAGEIETYLTGRAEETGLVLDCPPLVRFIVDEGLKRGRFDIIAESVSPAIIEELRREEMVHYGIEAPQPQPAAQPAPQPAAQPQQAPAPEPIAQQDTYVAPPVTTIPSTDVPLQRAAALFDFGSQQRYVLSTGRNIIGREMSCDVRIADPSVSRHHAEILHGENGWLIRDTGSTNGTSVNNTLTNQTRIYDGDIISLGNARLEFQED